MQLLTLDNESYLLDRVPDQVEEDMRFAVLDNSDPTNPDFFFIPLIYLESFSAPSAVLQIGDNKIQMPLDWHILLGDPIWESALSFVDFLDSVDNIKFSFWGGTEFLNLGNHSRSNSILAAIKSAWCKMSGNEVRGFCSGMYEKRYFLLASSYKPSCV